MIARDVVDAVLRFYGCYGPGDGMNTNEWAGLEEFQITPGLSAGPRIDLLMVRAWRGRRGHERHAIEVKVSRQDLRHELQHPEKRAPVQLMVNRFYLATPTGLTDGIELPADVGLIEVGAPEGQGQLIADTAPPRARVRIQAPHRTDPDRPSVGTFTEAFRRAGRAEARVRVAGDDDAAALAAKLRREVASLHGRVDRAENRAAAEKARAKQLLELFAATACPTVPCTCGGDLRPKLGRLSGRSWGSHGGIDYEHVETPPDHCRWANPDWSALAQRELGEPLEAE